MMMWKRARVARKSNEAPVAYPGAPLDSERAKQPPLGEVPYRPYAEKPGLSKAAYKPYAKEQGPVEAPYKPYAKRLPEVPYEPYKDI